MTAGFQPGIASPILQGIVNNTVDETIAVKMREPSGNEIERICKNAASDDVPHLECVKTRRKYPFSQYQLLKVS